MEIGILDDSSNNSSSSEDFDEEIRRPRVFAARINFNWEVLSDATFKEKFRISKTTAEYILNRIGGELQHPTARNFALNPQQQLLSALHWLGSGCQYHVCGDAHGISKATIHRCVHKVCSLLVRILLGEEVRWPTVNVQTVPQRFMRVANFPRVAGIVDGSLIQMDSPQENELSYVDRDGNHSINAMLVCGPNLEFFYASARWPGSVHDARVIRNSSLARQWNNGWRPFPNAVILGDSGYGLQEWLMTPVIPHIIPRTPALARYLRSLKSTRRMIENAIGILKEKFPCLNYLRVQPLTACYIILTCVVLHNAEKRLGSENYEPYNIDG